MAVRDLSATPRLSDRTEGNIFSRSSAGAADIVPGPRALGRVGHRLGYATNLSDLAAMLHGVPEAEQLRLLRALHERLALFKRLARDVARDPRVVEADAVVRRAVEVEAARNVRLPARARGFVRGLGR